MNMNNKCGKGQSVASENWFTREHARKSMRAQHTNDDNKGDNK